MNRNFPKGPGTKELKVFECGDGGLLYEFFRWEGWGQLAVRTVKPGKVAGSHRHPLTNEYWIFVKGTAMVYLEYEDGIREMRYVETDKGPVTIPLPAGTGHGVRNLGEDDLVFIFFADRIFDAATHDKEDWEW